LRNLNGPSDVATESLPGPGEIALAALFICFSCPRGRCLRSDSNDTLFGGWPDLVSAVNSGCAVLRGFRRAGDDAASAGLGSTIFHCAARAGKSKPRVAAASCPILRKPRRMGQPGLKFGMIPLYAAKHMGISQPRPPFIQRWVSLRPFLFHLTDRSNLNRIRETKTLLPAALLMERAGRGDLLRERRRRHEALSVDGRLVLVRDQAPLHGGNVALPEGYGFEDFVESINRRVFFWPGTEAGPIIYGVRHFARYEGERPLILRVGLQSLVSENPSAEPLYCKYNSGSPRCSHGKKSPRGPDTFLSSARFDGTPGQVVEVTFDVPVLLPADTSYGERPSGPWKLLEAGGSA
jgi:hypothetical protein